MTNEKVTLTIECRESDIEYSRDPIPVEWYPTDYDRVWINVNPAKITVTLNGDARATITTRYGEPQRWEGDDT